MQRQCDDLEAVRAGCLTVGPVSECIPALDLIKCLQAVAALQKAHTPISEPRHPLAVCGARRHLCTRRDWIRRGPE